MLSRERSIQDDCRRDELSLLRELDSHDRTLTRLAPRGGAPGFWKGEE